MKILLLLLSLAPAASSLRAADQPNILWITSEDNAWNWLGCYGNKLAVTPRLDGLASEGLQFTHAYSNGPVCAVARSTILNGAYAVTQGTQHMRSRHAIPESFKPYVTYLRDAGYYCTNNSKTDYNFKGNDASIWDDCSGKASYSKRPKDKPFFAIFNLTVSHESSLFPDVIARNRVAGIIPQQPRVAPSDVTLPPYLPDLPEIRSDIAIYQDTITALDRQVGKLLDQLKKAGLSDDTIVFYYGDHGGIIPRGKRYLEDTGVRVPLLVHIPEKWRALSPFPPGKSVDEVVSFVDLAPTLLSLGGIEKPAQMQGRAFLGTKRVKPPEENSAFLYADRFDELYGMRRGLADGRWKYIRCFTPYLPAAPYSEYSFGQAGWTAWRKAWQDGKLNERFNKIWQAPQAVECLFDTDSDPMEVRNLADDPAYATRLTTMRQRLMAEMVAVADTSLIPEPMFDELAPGNPIASYLASRKADIPALVSLAFDASSGDAANLPRFVSLLTSDDPVSRYWATQGILILGKSAESAADALTPLLEDKSAAVRISAAHALVAVGKTDQGKAALLAELSRDDNSYAVQLLMNVLERIDSMDAIPDAWVKRTLKDKSAGEYLIRIAKRIKKSRK